MTMKASNSNPHILYHATIKKLGESVILSPRVPKMKKLKSEDNTTKRVSLSSDKIKACIVASYDEDHLEDDLIKIHLYSHRVNENSMIYKPSINEVNDAEYYEEYWSLASIKLEYCGYYILHRKPKDWSEYGSYDHIDFSKPRYNKLGEIYYKD